MSKNQKPLNEAIDLDRIFKYVVTGYFGSKILDKAARNVALKDPEIKKKVKDLKADLESLKTKMDKVRALSAKR